MNPSVPRTASRLRRRGGVRPWLALLLGIALVAGACGDDDDDADTDTTTTAAVETEPTEPAADGGDTTESTEPPIETTAAPESEVDPEGILRIGAGLVFPGGLHLDPTISQVNADRPWMEMVFGTLLRWNEAGEIEPFMAESYEVVDPQTVTITLREGVTFTNGDPYDAEAVKAGLERTLTQSTEPTFASLGVAFKAISDITVVDPLTVTITLSTPQSGELVVLLTDREGVIVNPTQAAEAPAEIDSNPIGAGPYVVEEFIDAQLVSLRKNPDYFDPEAFQLGGIEWVSVTDPASIVNGLLSGDLDMALNVPVTDAARLQGDDDFTVVSRPTDRSYITLLICSGKPPFDDVDVRRALQLGIDRENVSDLVFEGQATPALGLWPEGHVYYNPELEDVVSFDPDTATELLGGETVAFDLAYIGAIAEHGLVAEVLQSQLGDVGFDVNLVATQDPVAEFITPQLPGVLLVPGSRTGVDKYDRVYSPGQTQALCGVGRPEIVEALSPATAMVPGAPEAADLFQAADLTIAENAYQVQVVWTPQVVVHNSNRLGGDQLFTAALSQPMLQSFHVKAG